MKTQLVIVGGGPAGVCSALAAARRGIQTVFVTNRPVLGGNSSSEIRVWSRGAVGAGNIYSEEMGVWGELKLTNLYRNPDCNPIFWDEVLLDAVLAEKNITLLLNTEISRLVMDGSRIQKIIGHQQGSEKRIEIEAGVFVDATGDGTLGHLAGVPYYMGNTYIASQSQKLPEKPELLGSSILFYTKKEDHPIPFIAPDYAYGMDEIARMVNCGGRILSEKMSGSDCWWFEFGGNLDTIRQSQDITIELKRLVMGVWNYIKNSGHFDAGNYTLEWVGNIPGKRDSRRMETDYILTEQDILAGRCFPDGAFYGGWYMDTHPSGGIHDTGEDNCVQIPVNVYQIPLRCLYNSRVPNLLFAGRNIGTERQVFVSSRVMNTCALAGQAAGELAAKMIQSQKAAAALSRKEIREIQLRLLRGDMFIPGFAGEDPLDLTPEAAVRASSRNRGFCGTESGTFSLKNGGYVIYPGIVGENAMLKVYAAEETALKGIYHTSALPNRLRKGQPAGKQSWQLQKGENCIMLKPRLSEETFVMLSFEPEDRVAMALDREDRTGFLCGQQEEAVYHTPRLSYLDELGLYGPEQLLTRPNRPWKMPNQWQASREDLSPWVELHWAQTQKVKEIRLFLDPSLNEELPSSRAKYWQDSHHFVPRTASPGHLIRNAALQIPGDDGSWQTLYHIRNNFQRQVRITLPEAVNTRAIRLAIEETWGSSPVIYQIRVYPTEV